MPVDDQVIVGAVFVLADAGFDQWRVFHRRKTEGDVIANHFQSRFAHYPFSGSWIELRTSRIVCNLESTSVSGWDSIDEAVAIVGPDRQLRFRKAIVSGGCTEEKDVLFRGANAGADSFRKELAQPGTAGEDIFIGHQPRAIRKQQAIPNASFKIVR